MVRKLVIVAVGLAVLLLTPYFLYGRHFGFQFGEAEMRAAVEGTWVAKLVPEQGAERTITFTIEQAGAATHSSREGGWIRGAAACGHRTFVKSAEACLDLSEMTLKLVAIDGERSSDLKGTFYVVGTSFERGELQLGIGDNMIRAKISRAGEVLEVATLRGTVRLEHLASPPGGPAAAPRS